MARYLRSWRNIDHDFQLRYRDYEERNTFSILTSGNHAIQCYLNKFAAIWVLQLLRDGIYIVKSILAASWLSTFLLSRVTGDIIPTNIKIHLNRIFLFFWRNNLKTKYYRFCCSSSVIQLFIGFTVRKNCFRNKKENSFYKFDKRINCRCWFIPKKKINNIILIFNQIQNDLYI